MSEEKQELLKEWVKLKKQEDKAKAKKDEISEKLQKFYVVPSDKKSKTFKEDDYEIEIKKNTKVKIDQDDAGKLVDEFGKAAPFEKEYKLESAVYKALKKINESFYKRCSEAVTFTPGKTSVKVSKKEKKNEN